MTTVGSVAGYGLAAGFISSKELVKVLGNGRAHLKVVKNIGWHRCTWVPKSAEAITAANGGYAVKL